MDTYKHILACLDLSGIDTWIVRYGAFLANLMKSERLTFLHVIQSYDLPAHEQRSPQAELKLKEHLRWKVRQHTKGVLLDETKVEVLVKKENRDAAQVVVDFIRENAVDVTILGKKADEGRKEMYSGRIMSLGESDMLLVPLSQRHQFNHILMALDFSSYAERAYHIAAKIAGDTKAGMACKLLYTVPKAYFPFTLRQSSSEETRKRAVREMDAFLKKVEENPERISCSKTIGPYNEQGNDLMEHANATDAQLVVIGARGQTDDMASLLGMVSDQARKYKSPVPVLVAK